MFVVNLLYASSSALLHRGILMIEWKQLRPAVFADCMTSCAVDTGHLQHKDTTSTNEDAVVDVGADERRQAAARVLVLTEEIELHEMYGYLYVFCAILVNTVWLSLLMLAGANIAYRPI